MSEITEERFASDGLDPGLDPIGNGTYLVKMRLTKDLPNWAPMFGRKICLDYRGFRRQCSNCYGHHAKKFCRSERVGMDNFVKGFSLRYNNVPKELYGRHAIDLMSKGAESESSGLNTSTAAPRSNAVPAIEKGHKLVPSIPSTQGTNGVPTKPNIRIILICH